MNAGVANKVSIASGDSTDPSPFQEAHDFGVHCRTIIESAHNALDQMGIPREIRPGNPLSLTARICWLNGRYQAARHFRKELK